jgi:hypothetical protein
VDGEEITGVFISDDRTALAWEIANGDGGIFVVQAGYSEAEEIQELGDGWIALGGGR